MKYEIQPKLLSLMALLGVGGVMTGCHTPSIHKPNLIVAQENIIMKEQTVSTKYRLYEDNNDLILEFKLINNSDESIQQSLNITPYSVHYNGKQLDDISIQPISGPYFKPAIITIPPNENYTFVRTLNTDNQFLDGTHDYLLGYIENFNDTDKADRIKLISKKINFTWQKFENSNKGHLISQKLVDY